MTYINKITYGEFVLLTGILEGMFTTIVKGKEKVYTISEKGEYSFPIINRGSDKVTELKGTIKFGSPLTIDSTTFNGKQQTTNNKK